MQINSDEGTSHGGNKVVKEEGKQLEAPIILPRCISGTPFGFAFQSPLFSDPPPLQGQQPKVQRHNNINIHWRCCHSQNRNSRRNHNNSNINHRGCHIQRQSNKQNINQGIGAANR
ncbi:hypothetical protein COLO4_19618 [Corchorus olitorius]|uniref:Uncharacterized protein n=1 Tax=Corchorus olitorius TaxID=93759 RepID=A0A1R3J4I5_9ROSI|nr:hypothetical protein COLO4_19618 [Corchorus olitorius]